MNNISEMFAEKSFRRRSYAKPFFKLFVSAVCYPCTFRCKALNMVCLFLKQAFRDKHWHINILVAKLLEHTVKNSLNIFPNCVAVRSYYHTAFYACVRNELCFLHTSVYHFAKSSSIDVMESTIFFGRLPYL